MLTSQKILLIDNFDSFTYNLLHIVEQFANVDVIRVDKIKIKSFENNNYSKIIISPGPGVPNDYIILKDLILTLYKKIPILGICLGHQIIAETFGCKLFNLNEVSHGLQKKTIITNKSIIYSGIKNEFLSGRYHSWAVSNKNFCKDFIITAIDEDNVIMSIEHKIYNLTGIQYHPESIMTEFGKKIIKNWVLSNQKS